MSKSLSLKEWIDRTGVHEVAALLSVVPQTVWHWRRGHCLPRADQMQLIKKYSRGAVSYEAMIDSFQKKKALKTSNSKARV